MLSLGFLRFLSFLWASGLDDVRASLMVIWRNLALIASFWTSKKLSYSPTRQLSFVVVIAALEIGLFLASQYERKIRTISAAS